MQPHPHLRSFVPAPGLVSVGLRAAALGLCLLVVGLVPGLAPLAQAEKSDRNKQMVVEADKPGTVDLQRQVVVFNGNVSISQGSLLIRAERVELREGADGYRAATAFGVPGKQASYKQKRDAFDESVEGTSDRIEFDGRADTVRFIGNGLVRRLRGTAVADEITGALIVWDNSAELFSVTGGATSAANPGGRVRAVLSPRPDTAASAAAAASANTNAAPGPLRPSRTLGDTR
jgi:lipopolysaccharide export system protein LptA